MSEANNATRHAYQETFRRRKAEKDAIEAIRRVIILFLYIKDKLPFNLRSF
jgi:hypothetical protein